MSGIDVNRFVDLWEPLAKHLKCNICLNVYLNPMDTQCKHTFCLVCIKTSIETNGKTCPQCRQPLDSRKRPNADSDSVVIGKDVILEMNRSLNNIINDLKIKCDFESNGCKEVMDFGLMSHHLNGCAFRLCPDCGLITGDESQHNCVVLLKTSNNKLKQELEKTVETKDKVISKMMTKITEFEKHLENNLQMMSTLTTRNGFLNQCNDISVSNGEDFTENTAFVTQLSTIPAIVCPKLVLFGTHISNPIGVEFTESGLKFTFQLRNNLSENVCNFMIGFKEMQEFRYCLDPKEPMVFIKPNQLSNNKISVYLCLIFQSAVGFKLNIQSNDRKQHFIVISMRDKICCHFEEDLFKSLDSNHCRYRRISMTGSITKILFNP